MKMRTNEIHIYVSTKANKNVMVYHSTTRDESEAQDTARRLVEKNGSRVHLSGAVLATPFQI